MIDLEGQEVVLGVQCLKVTSSSSQSSDASRDTRNYQPPPVIDRLVARFDKIRHLRHYHLAQQLNITESSRDGVLYILSEHYTDTLERRLLHPQTLAGAEGPSFTDRSIRVVCYQLLQALHGLHLHGVVSRNVSSSTVLFDAKGNVKLTGFGLYNISAYGLDIDFPIGDPVYFAPEVIQAGPSQSSSDLLRSSHKADVWAIGVLALEMLLGHKIQWTNDDRQAKDPSAILQGILQFCGHRFRNQLQPTSRRTSSRSNFGYSPNLTARYGMDVSSSEADTDSLAAHRKRIEQVLALEHVGGRVNEAMLDFLCECLAVNPEDRPDASQLLSHELFSDIISTQPQVSGSWVTRPSLRCVKVHSDSSKITSSSPEFYAWPTFQGTPMCEIVHHWRLAGGDLDSYLVLNPAVRMLPRMVRNNTQHEPEKRSDLWSLANSTVYCVLFEPLYDIAMQHVESRSVPKSVRPASDESGDAFAGSFYAAHARAAAMLKPALTPQDRGYDKAVTAFRELLRDYPATTRDIVRLAHDGIPVELRLDIYCAILGVQKNRDIVYDLYEKENPSNVDRQIDVDIPRCHQYHAALSSATGHNAMRRILKTWVEANPDCAYAQGLDQLAGPILALDPEDEAKVFCCLQELVSKYTHSFYTPGTSSHLQHFLRTFAQLLAYWDPELAAHLDSINLDPELYAIPWFMTLFSHVLQIPKIYAIWDALLLGPPALTTFFGVTAMIQLREAVLPLDFHNSTQFFSKEISAKRLDVDKIVSEGVHMYHHTPPSASHHRHDPHSDLALSLADRKAELCPRISLHDLMVFRHQFTVIDVRAENEFLAGHIAGAQWAPDGSVSNLSLLMSDDPEFHVCVVGSDSASTREVANSLVKVHVRHVALLSGGMDTVWKEAPHLITLS